MLGTVAVLLWNCCCFQVQSSATGCGSVTVSNVDQPDTWQTCYGTTAVGLNMHTLTEFVGCTPHPEHPPPPSAPHPQLTFHAPQPTPPYLISPSPTLPHPNHSILTPSSPHPHPTLPPPTPTPTPPYLTPSQPHPDPTPFHLLPPLPPFTLILTLPHPHTGGGRYGELKLSNAVPCNNRGVLASWAIDSSSSKTASIA